jgi:cyclophilin family peptidyl-prolyl cis-trans isomerase/HEAT repeat protein
MNRFPLRAAGAAALGACLACATRPPAAPASAPEHPRAAPAEAVAFASSLEARATMLMREDERRFDAPAIDAAAAHPDARVRGSAAHAAGSIGDARGLPALARLSRDADASVRQEAMLGLEIGRFPEGAGVAAAALADPEGTVRCAAGRAVAALQAAGGDAVLVAAVRAEPRPCLFYALARFGTEAAASAARDLAGSLSPDIRRAAVYAFARNPVASSSAALSASLADPDAEAAGWAARALGILGDPATLPALSRALERREPGVRTLAANAIGQIEEKHATPIPPAAVARLVALSRDSHPSVAVSALSALRWFVDDRAAYRALHAQAVSGTGRRRIVAFLSEAAALGDRARPRIEEAAASPDVAFLLEAAASALRPGCLRDGSPRVREAAVGTLPFDAAGRPALLAMLADPDAGVRSAVIDRLAEAKDPEVVPAVAAAFEASRDDTIPDAALSAVRAAAALKTDAGRALLERAAASPRVLVAREACRALVEAFGADPSAHPLPAYTPGRTIGEYERLLGDADHPHLAIVRTARGSFTIALDPGSAPLTVANFEMLARKKFFDGSAFDRVVPWFVIQGGDPTGTLHGGPGYEIRDELAAAPYEAGAVGMGLEGPDTGGSQWFVTLSRQPHLDGRYPVFGHVIRGQDVVERIEQGDGLVSVTLSASP